MYKCPACTASFFFESNLKKHAAAKHRLNNYGDVRDNLASGHPEEYSYSQSGLARVRRVPREFASAWISAAQILDAATVPINDRVV